MDDTFERFLKYHELRQLADRMTRRLRALGIDAAATVVSAERIVVTEQSCDLLAPDPAHWTLRAWLIARDKDRFTLPLTTLETRALMRRN